MHYKEFLKKVKQKDPYCLFVKSLMVVDGYKTFHKSYPMRDTMLEYCKKADSILEQFNVEGINL